ncbi:MAG TPA: EAL domain-containing protein, partial [Acidimicrobiales bacterium]|nr:EAL domain-containing protein [Acidimicrobiales bacterium]
MTGSTAADVYLDRFVADLPDAAIAVDETGTIVVANDAAHALLGHVPGSLVGVGVEAIVPESARAQHAAKRALFQQQPRPRYMGGGMVLRAVTADGLELPVEISLAPVGENVVAILHDRSTAVRALEDLDLLRAMERTAVSLSAELAASAGPDVDRAIDRALATVCEATGADQALLYVPTPDGRHLALVNEWCAASFDPSPGRMALLPRTPFGWSGPRLLRGEVLVITDPVELPDDAAPERDFMIANGIRSAATVPLGGAADYQGVLALRWRGAPAASGPGTSGEVLRVLGNVFLAAHHRRAAEQVRTAVEEEHRLLLDTLAAGVLLVRVADGTIVAANPAASELVGAEPEVLVGAPFLSPHIRFYDDAGRELELEQRVAQLRQAADGRIDGVFGLDRPDGRRVWMEARGVPVAVGDAEHVAITFIDVTERRRAEELLSERALHDPLTGVANRLLLGEHAHHALARAAREGTTTALVFLDLDHFKEVNDRHGHAAGDALLAELCRRVQSVLRETDTLARVGGDEFVVVLPDLGDDAEAEVLAERIAGAVARPVEVDGEELVLSASIGVATASGTDAEHANLDELLRRADHAMYAAKEMGRSRWVRYSPTLETASQAKRTLELQVHHALVHDELVVFHQPIVDVADGRIVGTEALLRWEHPQRGLLGPDQFLDIAEDSELIIPIGQWVLEEACSRAVRWPDPIFVSVNLSARQIGGHEIVDRLTDVLERTGLPPHRLRLELTESALVATSHSVLQELSDIRALGIAIGLDDFGTGYSSMTYLHTLPLSFLKVDRSFVSELGDPTNRRAATIVDMVLRLAER